jgi:hypothetical protein
VRCDRHSRSAGGVLLLAALLVHGCGKSSGGPGGMGGQSGSAACGAAVAPDPLAVTFKPPGGTFAGSQTVELIAAQGSEIHFTTDGTLPTTTSPPYNGALTLTASTRVRALAVGNTGDTSREPAAATYLRVAADAQAFSSNLPILVIHTFEQGALAEDGTEFVPANLLALSSSGSDNKLLGPAVLDTRIGIHVRGQTSREFAKKQYAIELRAPGSDDDRDQALGGMPCQSDWVLGDAIDFDRALMRNALAFELSNVIGLYAPRTRFVEAFLVADGGEVKSAHFLGLFTLMEKIKRDAQRVNVTKLSALDIGDPARTGGYILRIDKDTPDFMAAGSEFQFVYPSSEDMMDPARAPQLGYIRDFVTDFGLAVRSPNFMHPTKGTPYTDYIGVDSFIDYNIINALTKNVDALRISTYFHKDRAGRLEAGPVWDFDRSLGTTIDSRATKADEWRDTHSDATDYFNEGFWHDLFRDPAFRARYKTRFLSLLQNELAPDRLAAKVDALAATIGSAAAARNFARWPDSPPEGGTWATELTILKDFLRQRAAFIEKDLATNF